eukprot:Hpha_TRINITY_DN15812_c0_g14::TRINITY_DN15812_c0_g14_i1::g.188740::m.188740
MLRVAAVLAACALSAAADEWQPLRDAIDAYPGPGAQNVWVTVGNASGRLFAHKSGSFREDVAFPIASAGKLIAGVAILTAVRDGHLGLDDYAWQHLPYWTRDGADTRSHVTLRSCLAFNSGFEGASDCAAGMDTAECVRHIYDHSPHPYVPGSHFNYMTADIHLRVAGQMAAAAAGTTLRALLESFLAEEGMAHSHFAGSIFLPGKTDNPELSGSFYTSGTDYDRFLEAYYNNRILSKELRAIVESHQYPEADYAHDDVARRAGHYGLTNWFQCQNLLDEQWRPECTADDIHHSAGAFGYFPNIDRRLHYYSLVSQIAFDPIDSGRGLQDVMAPIIAGILAGSTPVARVRQPVAVWGLEKNYTAAERAVLERVVASQLAAVPKQ